MNRMASSGLVLFLALASLGLAECPADAELRKSFSFLTLADVPAEVAKVEKWIFPHPSADCLQRSIEGYKAVYELFGERGVHEGQAGILKSLAQAYLDAGKDKEAERFFLDSLALRSEQVDVHIRLLILYSRQKRYAEAYEQQLALPRPSPTDQSGQNREREMLRLAVEQLREEAKRSQKKGDLKKAQAALKKAQELDPQTNQ